MMKIAIFDTHDVSTTKIETFVQLFLNSFQAVTLDLM